MKGPKKVVEKFDFTVMAPGLESLIKPEKLHMNINSVLINENSVKTEYLIRLCQSRFNSS